MNKQTEELKMALNKAFQLGQRYWSWADSEYSSHWKKADAAKAEFDQLVQDTINAALAEQPAQQEDPCPGCRKGGVCRTPKCGRLKLPADHPYRTEQPAQQEPVAWVCEASSSDEKHAIDYWPGDVDELPIGTKLYTSPQAQRTWVGLTDEEIDELRSGYQSGRIGSFVALARAIEAKLKDKNT